MTWNYGLITEFVPFTYTLSESLLQLHLYISISARTEEMARTQSTHEQEIIATKNELSIRSPTATSTQRTRWVVDGYTLTWRDYTHNDWGIRDGD
ncbi:hypothetical protein E2C01_029329 [Portunus trituberculatus]|uniref:Uncharacterized protein n=1 Tax=Portunus trituberculatus TaxID=210409 RepID=A0A5B7ENZ1_PORTR|nr:hypothetical protein [Portunus trituberculatus]